MLDIPRHVDAEGVGSLGQEIVRFIRKETVLFQDWNEQSIGRLDTEVRKATTVGQELLASEPQHEKA